MSKYWTDKPEPGSVQNPGSYQNPGSDQNPGYPVQSQSSRPQVVFVPVAAGDPTLVEELGEDFGRRYLPNEDPATRMLFIRKVYGLLLVQLIVTAGIMSLFIFVEAINTFVASNSWLYPTLMIVISLKIIVILCVIFCCVNVRRTFPINIILLFLLSVDYGIILGLISRKYKYACLIVVTFPPYGGGITIGIFFSLTIFAFVVPYDFTKWAPFIFIVVFTLIIFAFLIGFLGPMFKTANLIYTCIGVLILSVYIVFDTQLMMNGKTYQISTNDYVYAALNLYIDIITIFCCILQSIR